jgi:thiamine-monophosphate kinase
LAHRPNPGTSQETLADLGEWELIRRLGAFAPPGQFADDGALLPITGGGTLVVNTDVLVEGIHFSDATTAAADVGWRATAANLSDLAAMGCTAVVGITVALVAPAATPWPWVEGVYGGIKEALDTYGGVLLGGDCSGGCQRLLAITALGTLATQNSGPAPVPTPGAIRRGDGLPGDLLLSTGPHGLSRLGLALLQGAIPPSLDPSLEERAIQAHRRPRPRFDAVQALITSRPAPIRWRVGGCDSSDGLAAAAAAIGASSGCAALLNRDSLPLDPAMAGLSQAEEWCLGGGEDFELVLALEPAWAQALIAALPGTTWIGVLVAGEAGALGWSDGAPWGPGAGGNAAASGYSHFN